MPVIRIERRPSLKPVIGSCIIVACVVFILFSGSAGITKAGVNKSLSRFAGYITTEAAQNGRDAHFTYDSVAMTGAAFSRHAVVHNIRLDIASRPTASGEHWTVTTPSMLVTVDGAPGRLAFLFPDPVSITENGQPKLTLTFPAPLKYSYADIAGPEHIIQHLVSLPEHVTLIPEGGQPIVISYDGTPTIRTDVYPDTQARLVSYDFRNLRIATSEGTEATAAAISSRLSEKPQADGRLQGTYLLTVTDAVLHDQAHATQPYSVTVNVTYHKDAAGGGDMLVNDLALASSDFKIRAGGKFATAAGDEEPFGVGNIVVDGLPQFLSSELVPVSARHPLESAISKAIGHPATNHTEIVVRREKGGEFYVGGVTFSSLATSMLADLLTTPAHAAAPSAPAVTPASAPIPTMVPPVAVPAAAPSAKGN